MHARIAATIKRIRGKRSAQWLADRTVELGYPITRAQIANYESGRKRGLDIAELLVLAAALNVSPVTLVYPGPYGEDVEVLPGLELSEYYAAEWFSGTYHWSVDDPIQAVPSRRPVPLEEHRAWADSLNALWRWRHLDNAVRARDEFMEYPPDLREQYRSQIESYEKFIRHHKSELGVGGGNA